MFNFIIGFICSIIGVVLIIQYGNERAKTHRKKYFDWIVVLACANLIAAGMNFCKYFYK